MKAIALLIAVLMVVVGLTGVLWPEGLMRLATYSFSRTGMYVVAAVRIVLGTLLFTCAGAARTPKTIRVIGGVIFTAGLVGVLIGHEPAQRLSEWFVAKGPDTFRIAACFPLVVGFFIGLSTLTKERRP